MATHSRDIEGKPFILSATTAEQSAHYCRKAAAGFLDMGLRCARERVGIFGADGHPGVRRPCESPAKGFEIAILQMIPQKVRQPIDDQCGSATGRERGTQWSRMRPQVSRAVRNVSPSVMPSSCSSWASSIRSSGSFPGGSESRIDRHVGSVVPARRGGKRVALSRRGEETE